MSPARGSSRGEHFATKLQVLANLARNSVAMNGPSLVEFLQRFRAHGEQCAYVHRRGYRTERWSYRDVYARAGQFSNELSERGIQKGDRILVWGENCAEWVAVFFGCVLRGAVIVPLDHGSQTEFAQRIARQVDARVVVVSRRNAQALQQIPHFILEDIGKADRDDPKVDTMEVTGEDPLEIVFTSGTTAEPKGVVITHGNVLANLTPLESEIKKYLKYERWVHPVRFLNLLPLSHVFGQFLALYLPPIMAGTVIFQDTLSPTEVIDTIRRERVSVLVAVPRMLQSLKERVAAVYEGGGEGEVFRQKFARAEGSHYFRRWWTFRRVHRKFGWKFWAFICGGASLDSETEEFWRRLGYAVIQGYGLTETTSLISVNHPFRIGRGSIGKILPGREIKLAEDGEILVRGGGVARTRWIDGEATRIAQDESWYRTGDLGALDSTGNLYFKGRKKETIVTPAGMNVYPEDLEAALRSQAGLRDCVVVPVARGGNAEPCAVLLLQDSTVDAGALVKKANESLSEYQHMRVWYVWPEPDLPRTSTQKARRQAIQEVVEARLGKPEASGAAVDSLAAMIGNIAGRGAEALSSQTSLFDDLGLTSLERVDLLSAIEERYHVDLSETRFAEADTIGEIGKLLKATQPAAQIYHYPRWTLRWPVRWIRTAAYYLLVGPAVALLGRPRVRGRENLAMVRGPVLVISNHIDHVDVGFILRALPARLRHRLATAAGGEALEELRTSHRKILGRIIDRVKWTLGVALLNLFPLPRAAGFRRSFAYAGEAVDRGYSILVFPEGRHTVDGRLSPFRAGIGLLANRLGIPIVPMRIDGLFEVKAAGKRFAPPGCIEVRIGDAVRFPPASEPEEIAARLQKLVADL
jgi:long-chain acyl-CoA synthetase